MEKATPEYFYTRDEGGAYSIFQNTGRTEPFLAGVAHSKADALNMMGAFERGDHTGNGRHDWHYVKTDHCECYSCRADRAKQAEGAKQEDAAGGQDVRHCDRCGCKTWHVSGVCEWADGHKS